MELELCLWIALGVMYTWGGITRCASSTRHRNGVLACDNENNSGITTGKGVNADAPWQIAGKFVTVFLTWPFYFPCYFMGWIERDF